MKLVFLDTETTGLTSDPNARLVQVAYKVGTASVNGLYNPGMSIPPSVQAIHHITDKMVADKPAYANSEDAVELQKLLNGKDTLLVAHNAQFDIEMLRREGVEVPAHICTKRLAEYLLIDYTDLDSYSMQTLRYYFGIEMGDDVMAHSADGDVAVLEQVFNKLFDIAKSQAAEKSGGKAPTKKVLIERMMEISTAKIQPRMRVMFGKHAGMKVTELVKVDAGWCNWLIGKSEDPNDMLVNTLRYLLNHK